MCWIEDELTIAALWKKLEDSPSLSLKSQYNINLLAFIGKIRTLSSTPRRQGSTVHKHNPFFIF